MIPQPRPCQTNLNQRHCSWRPQGLAFEHRQIRTSGKDLWFVLFLELTFQKWLIKRS